MEFDLWKALYSRIFESKGSFTMYEDNGFTAISTAHSVTDIQECFQFGVLLYQQARNVMDRRNELFVSGYCGYYMNNENWKYGK